MARFLGLDIEPTALRAAVVRTSFRKAEIELYVHVPLEQATDSPARDPEVRDAITNVIRRIGSPPDSVICAVSGRLVSLRSLTLPKAAEKRIAEVLPFELESVLPFDVSEAIIDHQRIAGDDKSTNFIVAAVLESQLEPVVRDFERYQLNPRELCPAPLYLEELVALLSPEGNRLFVELRRESTEVAMIEDGRCTMTRTLWSGFSSWANDPDQLLRNLKQTLVSFRANGAETPSELMLLGEGTSSGQLVDALRETLDLPVTIAEFPEASSAQGQAADPAFARALGLARRGLHPGHRINLRRGRFSPHQAAGQLARYGNLLGACAVALLVSAMFALKAHQSLLLDEQVRLQNQLAATTREIFGTPASSVAGAELLLKNAHSHGPLPRFDALDALSVVSESVAPEIKHEVRRLRIEVGDDKREGRLELQGMLGSIEERDAIAQKLDEHPCFSDVEKGKTSSARGDGEINYQLEAIVRCPGEGGGKKRKN